MINKSKSWSNVIDLVLSWPPLRIERQQMAAAADTREDEATTATINQPSKNNGRPSHNTPRMAGTQAPEG